jgi:hypothetical protein
MGNSLGAGIEASVGELTPQVDDGLLNFWGGSAWA